MAKVQGAELGKGSSPRMRGTPHEQSLAPQVRGIIPAHAGNTYPLVVVRDDGGDHPRACGEHQPGRDADDAIKGSSPRMRGTHLVGGIGVGFGGIIPAHAGNTKDEVLADCIVRDHPRACGEHFVVAELLGHESGIIPAQAGNTQHI